MQTFMGPLFNLWLLSSDPDRAGLVRKQMRFHPLPPSFLHSDIAIPLLEVFSNKISRQDLGRTQAILTSVKLAIVADS